MKYRKVRKYRAPVKDAAGDFWLADLYASAFLVVRGHRVDRAELASDNKRLCFVFVGDEAFVRDYWLYRNGKAEVCPLTFVNAVYELKDLTQDALRKAPVAPAF